MVSALVQGVRRLGQRLLQASQRRLLAATAPSPARLVVGTLADLPRSKGELIAENALLRQQLLVLRHSVKRVQCTPTDRALLVLLASRLRAWRQALLWPRGASTQLVSTSLLPCPGSAAQVSARGVHAGPRPAPSTITPRGG